MSTRIKRRQGSELPDLTLPWQEQTGIRTWTDLDLTSGYTFTLTLTDHNGKVQLTKTTGITGYDGSVVVAWAVGELDLAVGPYTLRLRANETGTSKDRDYYPDDPPILEITP